MRNAIVHRGSVIDRHLVDSCPWMAVKIGDKVIVTHEALARYQKALGKYTLTVINRLRARYGIDATPARPVPWDDVAAV